MGDKTDAAWHPSGEPATDYADLAKKLHGSLDLIGDGDWTPQDILGRLAAEALADSVPASILDKVTASYDEALREARAERDALAHVIEEAPHTDLCYYLQRQGDPCDCWKSAPPAVSLAHHDAEVKVQALGSAAVDFDHFEYDDNNLAVSTWLGNRAAAIRAEANG